MNGRVCETNVIIYLMAGLCCVDDEVLFEPHPGSIHESDKFELRFGRVDSEGYSSWCYVLFDFFFLVE